MNRKVQFASSGHELKQIPYKFVSSVHSITVLRFSLKNFIGLHFSSK